MGIEKAQHEPCPGRIVCVIRIIMTAKSGPRVKGKILFKGIVFSFMDGQVKVIVPNKGNKVCAAHMVFLSSKGIDKIQ